MDVYFVVAQCFGSLALLIEIIRFQMKSSRTFFYVEPLLSTLYCLQFYLLNAHAAAVTLMVSIFRAICGVVMPQETIRKCILLVFIPAYIALTIAVYESFIDVLPAVALISSSLAFMIQHNRYAVTRLYILNNAIWVMYALQFAAYAQVVTSTMIIVSLVIGIVRHEEFFKVKAKSVLTPLKPEIS